MDQQLKKRGTTPSQKGLGRRATSTDKSLPAQQEPPDTTCILYDEDVCYEASFRVVKDDTFSDCYIECIIRGCGVTDDTIAKPTSGPASKRPASYCLVLAETNCHLKKHDYLKTTIPGKAAATATGADASRLHRPSRTRHEDSKAKESSRARDSNQRAILEGSSCHIHPRKM